MQELKAKIYDETNGISYTLVGDYYIPDVGLPEDNDRPIGKWGGCTECIWRNTTRSCSIT